MTKRVRRRALLCFCLALLGAVLSGCHTADVTPPDPANSVAPVAGWPRTLTDDTGTSVALPAPPKRIVSLAPSNTEILFDLGAGARVIADTESCDYPPEARQRPHIGGMSAGDLEKIQAALPDLVIAVGAINQKLVAALRTAGISTIVIDPHNTRDVIRSIKLIGHSIGADAAADRLAGELGDRIDRVRAATARVTTRPKVLVAYGDMPIYTSPPNSFIHDLIGAAGGQDIVQEPLPQNIISSAVVVERAPDVIICSRMLRDRLRALPGLGVVPAVKNDRFFSTSKDAEITRPGPRLAGAVEELAAYLHPELRTVNAGDGNH